eukprot:TRINITY_DN2727_c0_g2_i8.p1 TRINITY_DN2727_c0_g2~~TRINITY_DN2727_c0_g2_i8.p1  ORF type:complete len:417 (+),score=124.39 TRINITY_DN2727_c0_g2_i8:17-1267(+)
MFGASSSGGGFGGFGGAASSSAAGGFGGFGAASSSAAGGGFGGFGAASSSAAGGFGGFGAASSSAAGGFGGSSSAAGGFGGFGAASSSAAGGFGGFGASSSAAGGGGFGGFGASSGAASSAAGGFGGFGASSSAAGGFGGFGASSGAASSAAGGFGGFGASSSAAGGFGGFGASSGAASSAGGFGGFGAASSSAAGGGFGGFGAAAPGAAAAVPPAELPAEWKKKTLKEIVEDFERFLEEDKTSFASAADAVIRLDLALHEVGDNILRLRSQVEDCKKSKVSLEGTISSLDNDLDSLEKKVTVEVERNLDQLLKASAESDQRHRGGVVGGYDKERLVAYEKARAIEDRLQNIEYRLQDKVDAFNCSMSDDHSPVRSLTNILDQHVEYMRSLDTQIEKVKKQASDASEKILGVRHQM